MRKTITTSLAGLSSLIIALHSFAGEWIDPQRSVLDELKSITVKSETSYNIVESLTTEVGARLVGTPASDKGVDWAVAKMKALGFDNVWVEESTMNLWERGELQANIVSPFPHKVVALSLGGSVGTSGETVSAEVVQFDDLDALKAAKPNSLKGKIAFVSYRMERKINGSGYGVAVGARVYGASEAAKKGALAYIMRSVGTDDHRVAHTGLMLYQDDVKKIPAIALSNPDADLLLNSLKRDNPVVFSLNSTASGPTGKSVRVANVVGDVLGSETPDEVVTLGAHLDSWDVGTGAIDDGVGVGITLAAAHYISKLEKRPKRSVRVILFAAEEVGLIGAKDYVEKHKDDMHKHIIGAEWDFANGNIYMMEPGVGPSALNAIRDFANYLAPMGVSLASTNTAKGQSDMSALGNAGQPAINFSPDGSDYFDYHHTENDTLNMVDKEALKNNTAIYTLYAYFAAQSGVDFRK